MIAHLRIEPQQLAKLILTQQLEPLVGRWLVDLLRRRRAHPKDTVTCYL